MPSSATARHVRAVALASASFGLGLAGHLEAGGHATSPISVVLAGAFCALSGWSYSRRRLTGPSLVGILLGNQVVVHLALAMGSAMGPATMTSMGADCAAGHSGADPAVMPGSSGGAAAGMAMQLIPGGWMALAHLAATALTAGVLLAVQALCVGFSVVARWLARVVRVASGTSLALPGSRPTVWAALPSWTTRAIGARPGRGPPLLPIV